MRFADNHDVDYNKDYDYETERSPEVIEFSPNIINGDSIFYRGPFRFYEKESLFPVQENCALQNHHKRKKSMMNLGGKENLRDERHIPPSVFYYYYLQNLKKRESDDVKLPDCQLDHLMSYLARLQIINPESIVNLASEKDIDALCKKLSSNVAEVNKYLQTCEPPQQKDLYLKLINGVRTLNKMICVDKKFKNEFKKHENCLCKLNEDFETCIGPNDWVENPDTEEICRTYADLSACYYKKTLPVCGQEAAIIIKNLMKEVVNSVITVYCDSSDSIFSRSTAEHRNTAQSTQNYATNVQPDVGQLNERETVDKLFGNSSEKTNSTKRADLKSNFATKEENNLLYLIILFYLCISLL